MPLLRVILLALLGGLILNGMPCVLPILGIKICSAAELAQHDPGELRRHGFAYLAGVLASMAALAAAARRSLPKESPQGPKSRSSSAG